MLRLNSMMESSSENLSPHLLRHVIESAGNDIRAEVIGYNELKTHSEDCKAKPKVSDCREQCKKTENTDSSSCKSRGYKEEESTQPLLQDKKQNIDCDASTESCEKPTRPRRTVTLRKSYDESMEFESGKADSIDQTFVLNCVMCTKHFGDLVDLESHVRSHDEVVHFSIVLKSPVSSICCHSGISRHKILDLNSFHFQFATMN